MFKILRALFSFAVVLVIAELFLRGILQLPATWNYLDRHQELWANSQDLRRLVWYYQNENPEHRLSYPIDDYHERRGWALKPDLKGVPCCGSNAIHSNSKGLRGTTEFETDSWKKMRIAVFGDSYTFGEQVEDRETYSARLAEKIPGSEVMNFGVHGYGFDQMLLYLRDEGLKYRPDYVILGYVPDDEHRGMYEFRDYAKPWFEWNGEGVVPTPQGIPVPKPEQVRAEVKWRSRLLDVVNGIREMRYRESDRYWRRVADLTDLILGEFAGAAAAAGATPIFVYFPTQQGISDPDGKVNQGRIARFEDFCKKLEVKCLSLQERFTQEMKAGAAFAPANRHWGPLEHQVAADEISKFLIKDGRE